MGLSSPTSRLAEYLVAGKEFGTRFNKTRFLEFVIETFETVTRKQATESAFHPSFRGERREKKKKDDKHTPRLILEEQTPRVIQTTTDIAHIEAKAKNRAQANKRDEPKTPKVVLVTGLREI